MLKIHMSTVTQGLLPRQWPAIPLLLLVLLLTTVRAEAQPDTCAQPEPVCTMRAAVFAVSGPLGIGSATRLSATELVTARHVVLDEGQVVLFLPDGQQVQATVVPSAYAGDIILLRSDALPEGPVAAPGLVPAQGALYTIGADVSFGLIRAYDPGAVILPPAPGHPLARLHHSAYSQPAHSGGALVGADGTLVGIVAAGGEGRYEAIPAGTIADLRAKSGAEAANKSAEIGAATRICGVQLDRLRRSRAPLAPEEKTALVTSCTRSRNRQNIDLAAQTLGARGDFDGSIALFQRALEEDPNALNSRAGLSVTYHLAARYEEEIPHLKQLMSLLPEDDQILRLALQAGTWSGDRELAEAAFARIQAINPAMAPVARKFLDNPPPRPKRR